MNETYLCGSFGVIEPLAPAAPSAAPSSPTKTKSLAVALRSALRQGAPGAWASDHREETNQFNGWNYVAIRALALQAAQASVSIYMDPVGARRKAKQEINTGWRRKSMGEKLPGEELPPEHPFYKVMRRPNPHQSGASFRYEQVVQLALTGTCLVWKVRNQFGLTVERYVIPTAMANPVLPCREFPGGAWKIENVGRFTNAQVDEGFVEMWGWYRAIGSTIPAEDMLVVRWPHPLYKDDGYSPVSAGAQWSDTAKQIDTARWSHLRNGPDPSLLISPPDEWDGDQAELTRAQTLFNQQYSGPEHHGKAMFAVAGEVTLLSTTPREMSYETGFPQLRDAILAVHGTPGIAAGITDGGSYAAFYASIMQFVELTVQPTLSLLAEEETEQQAPEFGAGLTVEIEAKRIDDPDLLERQLATDITAGVRTVDEIRSLRGLDPLPDGAGGKIAGPMGAAGAGMGIDAGMGGGMSEGVPAQSDPLATGQPGAPAIGDMAAGDPSAAPTGGEFGELSRQQWIRNRRAIQDVLDEVRFGETSQLYAVEMLTSLGMSPMRAEKLVQEAMDLRANAGVFGNGKANGKGHENGHAGASNRIAPHLNGHAKTMLAAVSAALESVESTDEAKAILKQLDGGDYP